MASTNHTNMYGTFEFAFVYRHCGQMIPITSNNAQMIADGYIDSFSSSG